MSVRRRVPSPALRPVHSLTSAAADTATLNVRISWGHEAAQASAYEIKPVPGAGVEIQSVAPRDLESGEAVKQGVARTRAGGGDVDALDLVVVHPKEPAGVTQNVHILWTDLMAASDPDTAQRLARDPSFRTRPPMLTIQMDAEGTKGFSVSIDQLKTERALWIPSLGVYITATVAPRSAGGLRRSPQDPRGSQRPAHPRSREARTGSDRRAIPRTLGRHGLAALQLSRTARPRPHRRHHMGQRDPQVRDRSGRRRVERRRESRQVPVLAVGRRSRARRRAHVERAAADRRIADPHDDVRGGWAALRAGAVRVSARRAAGRAARRHRRWC